MEEPGHGHLGLPEEFLEVDAEAGGPLLGSAATLLQPEAHPRLRAHGQEI
jgi:hypothetical protein